MKLHELNEVHQVVADNIGIYRINPDAVLETPSFFSEEQNQKYDDLMDYFISQLQQGKPIAL